MEWLYALIAFVLGVVVGYLVRGRQAGASSSGPKHALVDQPKPAEPVASAEPAEAVAPEVSEEDTVEEPEQPVAAKPSGLLSPSASRAAAERARQDPALNQLDDEHRTSVLRETPAPASTETPAGQEVPDATEAIESTEPTEPTATVEAPAAEAEEASTDTVEASVADAEPPVDSPSAATVDDEPAVEAPADPAPVAEPVAPNGSAMSWEPGPYPESALPVEGGDAPADEFTIKAKADSKLFHTEKSPYYRRVKPDVWFRTEADAVAAGFTGWVRRAKTK